MTCSGIQELTDNKKMVLLQTVNVISVFYMYGIQQTVGVGLVAIVVKEHLIYGKDNLTVQCLPEGIGDFDSIFRFTLSKEVNGNPIEIVRIESDTSSPPSYLRVVWSDDDMKTRALVKGSKLLPIAEAKLNFFVNSSMVSCNDNGMYLCHILVSGGLKGYSSGSVAVEVLKHSIHVVDITPIKRAIYNIGDTVSLQCRVTSFLPSCMKWCITRENDAKPMEYDIINNMVNSDLSYDGCQYSCQTDLTYNVTKEDTNTTFICDIADKQACSSEARQGQVAIRNSNVYLVKADLTENILYRKQSLRINCISKQVEGNERIDRIALSKIHSGQVFPLIESKYSQGSGTVLTTWNDDDFKNRATLMHSYILPDTNGTLHVEIPANKVECRDAVMYRCEMFLLDNKRSLNQRPVKLIVNGQFVETRVTPLIELGKDALDLQCITSYFEKADTINQIILSKIELHTTKNIFGVELRHESKKFNTRLNWYSDAYKSISEVIRSAVYPASQAGLHVRLKAEHVRCVHAGNYTCTVTASNGKHGSSEASVDVAVKSAKRFIVTENTCSLSNGQYNVGHKTVLKCGGDVGNPPRELVWCRRMLNESMFSSFLDQTKMSSNLIPIPQDCTYEKYSVLEYNVTDDDVKTEFGCVSTGDDCSLIDKRNTYIIQKTNGADEKLSQNCYKDVIKNQDVGNPGGYIAFIVILALGFLCLAGYAYKLKKKLKKYPW